ncbi:MAG: DUF169 domain-containing protein [Actinobacteria bacterium]|nr:DUF169 domain-containing protein [Actinomycetota bacterium]
MEGAWKEELAGLVALLGLEHRPVAVTFTNDEVEGGESVKKERISFCSALKRAAAGEAFIIDRETSACPGGSWHCGLAEPPSGERRRFLQDFLTRGEKLTHSIVSFHRMQALGSPPPTGLSERVVMGPGEEAEIRPDLVVFLCNGEQACRLITLDHYWDGIPPRVELTGALCHAAIAYPVVTGRTNVTFGDWTARRMQKYPADVVFVTVPYERMANLVAAVPRCSAGNAPLEVPREIEEHLA